MIRVPWLLVSEVFDGSVALAVEGCVLSVRYSRVRATKQKAPSRFLVFRFSVVVVMMLMPFTHSPSHQPLSGA